MLILNRYLTKDFLVIFGMTLLVVTFIMCVSAVIKAIDLLSRGVSGWFIFQVFALNIPFILSFSIPISVLTANLLLFSRLSHDGEITAMKACGLSLWQIVSPVILLAIAVSLLCIYINASLAPVSHFMQRRVLVNLGVEEPINLLEEGRFVRDFPGLMIYVGKKDRKRVSDIVVYELGENGIQRNIRAKTGTLTTDRPRQQLVIDLTDVRIDEPDPQHPMDLSRSRYVPAERYQFKLDLSGILRQDKISKKAVDMTFRELIEAIRNVRAAFPQLQEGELRQQRMKMILSFNERLALSLACFAFTLLGIPLGIKSHRKESSAGIGISLLLVFVFYFFIILADSLVGHPEVRPDLFVWIPVVGAEILGLVLLQRAH